MVQQHEREQARDLLMTGGGGQLAGQPDRLGGQVDVAGVALVEDEVEHPQHGGDVARLVEPDAGDGPLGPADPLGHGRLRHQVRLRDLTRGQAADGTQREGDGRGRRQGRVRAQEVQLEGVVGYLARAGLGLALDERLPVPSGGIGAGAVEELAPGDRDQPALRVPGRVVGPHPHGLDQGILHGILGRREVSSATDEDADHGGGEGPQQGLVDHRVSVRDGRRRGKERAHLKPLVDRLAALARGRRQLPG